MRIKLKRPTADHRDMVTGNPHPKPVLPIGTTLEVLDKFTNRFGTYYHCKHDYGTYDIPPDYAEIEYTIHEIMAMAAEPIRPKPLTGANNTAPGQVYRIDLNNNPAFLVNTAMRVEAPMTSYEAANGVAWAPGISQRSIKQAEENRPAKPQQEDEIKINVKRHKIKFNFKI